MKIEQQNIINQYRAALDALIELNNDMYRQAINQLRQDIVRLESWCDDD